mmetsp:Transcript_69757/g.130273  ORF Transcript_69757/g.130273 Transcript_69757/m.130273 type:complete len:322 (+) Transcript_69757:166-1131(+)
MGWVPQLASGAGSVKSLKPVGKRPVQNMQDPIKAVETHFAKVFRGAKGETYTMERKDHFSWNCHREQHGQSKTFTLRYDKESSCVWWGNWTYCADPAEFTKFPDRMFWYPCADDRQSKSQFVWDVVQTVADPSTHTDEAAPNPKSKQATTAPPPASDRQTWRPRMRECAEPVLSKDNDVSKKKPSRGGQTAKVNEVEASSGRIEDREEALEPPSDLPPGLEAWNMQRREPVSSEVMTLSSNSEEQPVDRKLDATTLEKDADNGCGEKYEADTCADSSGEPQLTDSDSDLGCKDQGEHDRDEQDLAIRFEEWRQFWRVALRA